MNRCLNPDVLKSQYFSKLFTMCTQVEVNLMAASMGSLAEGVSKYHDSVLHKHFNIKNSQHQRLVQGQAEGLVRAWRHYNVPDSVVLLVEDSSFNWFDQQVGAGLL